VTVPRKRRLAKQRREPPLLAELDFFCRCTRSCASIDRVHAAGHDYDPFLEFSSDQLPRAAFRELWHRHESAIRAHAKSLGVPLPDPAQYVPFPRGQWIVAVIN
jgi:hypothetical protein